MENFEKKLDYLRNLKSVRLGKNKKNFSEQMISETKRIYETTTRMFTQYEPEIFPTLFGSIIFEWKKGNDVFTIKIESNSKIRCHYFNYKTGNNINFSNFNSNSEFESMIKIVFDILRNNLSV